MENPIYRELIQVFVVEMPIEIPDIPNLHGEKAIEALSEFVAELEKQSRNQPPDKQAKALTKIAKAMIASLEAERETSKSKRVMRWFPFSRTKAAKNP